jgi:hypothetical protein
MKTPFLLVILKKLGLFIEAPRELDSTSSDHYIYWAEKKVAHLQ